MIPQTTTTTALALPAASTLPEHRVRSDAVQRASASSGVLTTTHQAAGNATTLKLNSTVPAASPVFQPTRVLAAIQVTVAQAPVRRGRFALQTSSARFHALPMHWARKGRSIRTTVRAWAASCPMAYAGRRICHQPPATTTGARAL